MHPCRPAGDCAARPAGSRRLTVCPTCWTSRATSSPSWTSTASPATRYEQRDGNVILAGDLGPHWSHSYFSLFAHRQVADGRNGLGNHPPRSIGSSASPLLTKAGRKPLRGRRSPSASGARCGCGSRAVPLRRQLRGPAERAGPGDRRPGRGAGLLRKEPMCSNGAAANAMPSATHATKTDWPLPFHPEVQRNSRGLRSSHRRLRARGAGERSAWPASVRTSC